MQFLDERISLIYGSWFGLSFFYPIAFCCRKSKVVTFFRKDFGNRPNFLDRVEFCVSFLMGIWFGLKWWASLPSYSSGYTALWFTTENERKIFVRLSKRSFSLRTHDDDDRNSSPLNHPHTAKKMLAKNFCCSSSILQVIFSILSFSCWKVAPHACFDASLVWK